MRFDDVLTALGEFGAYQRIVYVAICSPIAFHGIQIMANVFTLAIPQYRCAVPGLGNDTYLIQGPTHQALVDMYIPKDDYEGYSKCESYVISGLVNRDFTTGNQEYFGNSSKRTSCKRWVYDRSVFENTVVTEMDLVCSRTIYRAHVTTMMYVGSVFGMGLVGPLSDRYGRKIMGMTVLLAMIVTSLFVLWLPNIYTFIVIRFFVGVAFGPLFSTSFVYAMEFIGPYKRATWGVMTNTFWGVGVLVQAGIAYAIRSWRHLQLAFSLPIIICLAYWWKIPESVRWLLIKGKRQEAGVILKKMAKVNKVTLDVDNLDIEVEEESVHKEKDSFIVLFKQKELAVRAMVIFINWFVVSMLFYGIAMNVGNLSGDLFANFAISSVMEVVGYIISIPLIAVLGRKRFHAGCMLLGGVCLLGTIIPEMLDGQGSVTAKRTLAMIGKLIASAAFATIYVFSSELFPTVVRATAMGTSANFAHVGAIVSPYLVELANLIKGPAARVTPMLVFGSASLVAGLASLILPDTTGMKLPDTLDDLKRINRHDVRLRSIRRKRGSVATNTV